MTISWYPGHMRKASKELAKIMRKTHAVIEILDARIPAASSNPLLASIRGQIPCIKVLSKADLADASITRAWRSYFNAQDGCLCLLNGLDNKLSAVDVISAADRLLRHSRDQLPAKRQLVIVGIPNVGKSTLLNQIADRKIAKTGNEPAVTKTQQRVRLDEKWYLVDTPGLLWPKLEDQTGAYRLACTGTIRNTAVEAEDVAWFVAEWLLREHRQALSDRYQLHASIEKPEQLLQSIAESRGCIGKGGRPDWHKTAETLLNDYRSGKLGRFSLEHPPE